MTPVRAWIEEWKQLQAQLVDQERLLADLALQHARGEATVARLDHESRTVELLREMAQVAFDRMMGALRPEE